jgi:catechol 2,3-dioxygenase-like lactoylglutathione lyase family enzyme
VPAELAAIGIVTRHLEESLRFYRLLGVVVPEPEGHHVDAVLPNGLRLMWDTVELAKQLHDDWTEPHGQPIALAFQAGSAAEVDALYARMVEAGFRGGREPWDAFWGQRYAWVYDPDDNQVDLFAPLAASASPSPA